MLTIQRWRTTWGTLGQGFCDDGLFFELMARYDESHRKYHTTRHLTDCFARWGEVRSLAKHPAEVELALWFHDAVYDVFRTDNEEKSAELAHAVCINSRVSPEVIDRICSLILATRHKGVPTDADARVLVDVDLSILAADEALFDEYENQIRAEYSWVPVSIFREKRREILEGFLSRDRIFFTDHFLEKHESRARANLRRSIELLSA